jgi:hypothetical protein
VSNSVSTPPCNPTGVRRMQQCTFKGKQRPVHSAGCSACSALLRAHGAGRMAQQENPLQRTHLLISLLVQWQQLPSSG